MTNSTISGNSATFEGGGINYAAIPVSGSGSFTLNSSTISGNSATYEGGGIFSTGPTNVGNTIIANNTFKNRIPNDIYKDFISQGGNFISNGFNLIGDGTGIKGFTNGVNGDQVGTDSEPIDPKIGPLKDNGGPTQTLALRRGSPAIDAANPQDFPPTDQRGVSRPQGEGPDIGAYERRKSFKKEL